MAALLPVRLLFRLPPGWVQADPDEVGESWSAFVAGHPNSMELDFAAKITISGSLRPDSASLADIAYATVPGLGEIASAVQLVDHREIGSESCPGVTQVIRFTMEADGIQWRLIQSQVFLGVRDRDHPLKRAVVKIALTATPRQFPIVINDFESFLRTVRPGRPGDQP